MQIFYHWNIIRSIKPLICSTINQQVQPVYITAVDVFIADNFPCGHCLSDTVRVFFLKWPTYCVNILSLKHHKIKPLICSTINQQVRPVYITAVDVFIADNFPCSHRLSDVICRVFFLEWLSSYINILSFKHHKIK